MSDAEAVASLVGHPYFRAGLTPVQLFNRATEPFLPAVRPHTFAVLEDLDGRGLTNHVLIITRHQVNAEDCGRLNRLRHLKVTLLFTYSGIDEARIEPYPSTVAAASLKLATSVQPRRYRTIFYWRPLVPDLNDTDEHLARAAALGQHADATVFTGLFYRDEIAGYYQAAGLPEPYSGTARRKIVPETLEQRVLAALAGGGPVFRKTSCAVSYVHGLPDYNGHFGVRELCDICPLGQLQRCAATHHQPTVEQVAALAAAVPDAESLEILNIDDRAVVVDGLPHEQPRYFLQHALRFQVHDRAHPHYQGRHGRAEIGWQQEESGT